MSQRCGYTQTYTTQYLIRRHCVAGCKDPVHAAERRIELAVYAREMTWWEARAEYKRLGSPGA